MFLLFSLLGACVCVCVHGSPGKPRINNKRNCLEIKCNDAVYVAKTLTVANLVMNI